nr:hypothetical protein [Tanacetum cinerariifolium]
MEMAVEQHYAEKTEFQNKMENVLKENNRLLTHALGVEIVNIVEKDTVIVKLKEKIKSSSADVKERKDLFTSFDQYLIDEVSEVQKIFKQIEMAIEQHNAAKTKFQTKMEIVLKENDRLLTHALGVDIVNIVVNDCMNVNYLTVDACEQCVTTESELKTNFIQKENYETLLKQYHILEKHCTSLELNNQLNMEIFQRDTVSSSESAPTFAELFETNELKAQIQEKDTVILKLKEKIKSLRADDKERKEESKVEDIET